MISAKLDLLTTDDCSGWVNRIRCVGFFCQAGGQSRAHNSFATFQRRRRSYRVTIVRALPPVLTVKLMALPLCQLIHWHLVLSRVEQCMECAKCLSLLPRAKLKTQGDSSFRGSLCRCISQSFLDDNRTFIITNLQFEQLQRSLLLDFLTMS